MYQRKRVNWIFNIGRCDFLDEELFVRFLSVNAPGVEAENISVGDYATTFTAPASATGKILALKGARFNAKSLYVRENRRQVDAADAERKGTRRGSYPSKRQGSVSSRRYSSESRSNRRADGARQSENGNFDGEFRERSHKPYGDGVRRSEKGNAYGVRSERADRYRERNGDGNRTKGAERYLGGVNGTGSKSAYSAEKGGRDVATRSENGTRVRADREKIRKTEPKHGNEAATRNAVRIERYQDGGERPVRSVKKRPVFDDHGVEYVNDPIREGNYRPKHRVDINKD